MSAAPAPFLPVPLESLRLPAALDGRAGSNRARGRAQLAADTDADAVAAWLSRFSERRPTFDAYRKEAERLLLWAAIERGRPLSSLTHEDLLLYQRFLADPQPAARWVLPNGRKRARGDPGWRPFAGPLSPASARQALVIVNGLFAWLVQAGYLAGNPLALARTRGPHPAPRVTRFLDDDLWGAVKAAIAAMPRDSSRAQAHAARVRWLFSLLYLCGLRVSEVVNNTMGGFFCRRDRDGEERWWLEVAGKGGKTRLVPATTELMAELARYRRMLSLPPLPLVGETAPLLFPVGGRPVPMTRGAVHAIVKQVFEQAAARLRQQGPQAAPLAERLAQASAHWLRHTAGSHMANGDVDLRHVRDNLGHRSLSTTSVYLHAPDDQRHRETDAKHRLNWATLDGID